MHQQQSQSTVPAATPLPLLRVCVLGMILVANSVSIWMIFTMLPFMIEHYFPTMSVKELGFRAGILGSSFSLGALLGNLLWGLLADRIGRRPTLLGGLIGTGVASLLFGFAPSFWAAVFTRFMWGMVNGNIGLGRTYMGEILDDSNNARGMALFSLFGGMGRTLGPALGGFLSSPAVKYPLIFRGTTFQEYPFALPCIIVTILCTVVFVLAFFFLPETLKLDDSITRNSSWCCCRADTPITTTTGNSVNRAVPVSSRDEAEDIEMTANNRSKKGSYSRLETTDMDDELKQDDLVEQQRRNQPQASSPTAQDESNCPGYRLALGKKRLTFSNVVVVKVIGSESLAFGSLKRLSIDDEPVAQENPAIERKALDDDYASGENDEGREHYRNEEENDQEGDDQEEEEEEEDDAENDDPNVGSGGGGSGGGRDGEPPGTASKLPRYKLRFSNGAELVGRTSSDRPRAGDDASLLASVMYLLSRKEIMLSTTLYGLNSFLQCVATEIFPLWVVTSVRDGGFGFDSNLVGIAVSISGVTIIVSNLVIYPILVARLGLLKVYRLSCNLLAVTVVLMPSVPLARHFGNQAFTWACLLGLLALFNCACQWVMTCIYTLINNSCYTHQRATVNGLGQTFASTGRLLAPYLGALLFAWTETKSFSWPLNYALTWYLVGVLSFIAGQLGLRFTRSAQRRKREPRVARYTSQTS